MDELMRAALEQPKLGFGEGGVPTDAALVSSGKLIETKGNRWYSHPPK